MNEKIDEHKQYLLNESAEQNGTNKNKKSSRYESSEGEPERYMCAI